MTGNGSSCGACKFLRRRCTGECVFSPYFRYEQAASHFAAVHKIFGASNASKLLLHLPVQSRSEAAVTIAYEALARMQDPIYGCVAQIFALQQQVATLKEEIATIGNQITSFALDVPSKGIFQVPNDLNSELAFWCDNMNLQNHINQQIPVLPNTGNISANQACGSQIMEQHPPINGWKNDIPQLYSNSNIMETVFEELSQNVYLQSPWTENDSTSK